MNQAELRTGDVILERIHFNLYKPGTWLSLMIRFFTGFRYNHVGVIVVEDDVPYVIDAQAKGIRKISLHRFLDPNRSSVLVLRHYWTNADEMVMFEEQIAREANEMVGVPYDLTNLLIHQPILRLFGKWTGSTGQYAKDKFQCAEFAGYIYRDFVPKWWAASAKELYKHKGFYWVCETIEPMDQQEEWLYLDVDSKYAESINPEVYGYPKGYGSAIDENQSTGAPESEQTH